MTTDHTRDPEDERGSIDDSTPEHVRVRSLLASLPDPGAMPDDLVARIQARLEDEARGTVPFAPVVDLASRRRRRLVGVLAGAGAVAASAAVVGVLLHGGLGSLADSSGSAVAEFGSIRTVTMTATPAPVVHISISDTPVMNASLDAEASRLLNATPATPLPGTAESPTIGPLGTPQGLTDCLSSLQAPAYTKVAAELTTFDGTPAVVLGMRTASGDLQAWALDRTCKQLAPMRTIS